MCQAELGDEWFPRRSKMVLMQIPLTPDGSQVRLNVHVDPASPSAWRREPYFSQLKRWTLAGVNGIVVEGHNYRRQVLIYVGDTGIMLLPDKGAASGIKEVDLGVVTRHNIFVTVTHTPSGLEYGAYREPFIEDGPPASVGSQPAA